MRSRVAGSGSTAQGIALPEQPFRNGLRLPHERINSKLVCLATWVLWAACRNRVAGSGHPGERGTWCFNTLETTVSSTTYKDNTSGTFNIGPGVIETHGSNYGDTDETMIR